MGSPFHLFSHSSASFFVLLLACWLGGLFLSLVGELVSNLPSSLSANRLFSLLRPFRPSFPFELVTFNLRTFDFLTLTALALDRFLVVLTCLWSIRNVFPFYT